MTSQEAFASLRFGFESGRAAQAYLVVGSIRGAARELVDGVLSLLFCESDTKPCGVCRGCRDALAHTHSDLLWLEPQKKSRKILIQQIRDLQQRVFQTSFAGGWKVCVLASADRLGVEASNAFLKTLEEPPGKTVFFLVTDSPHFLLPTIISRCQRITVMGASDTLVAAWRDDLLSILAEGRSHDMVGSFSRSDRMETIFKAMKETAKQEELDAAQEEVTDEDDETLDARVTARYKEMRMGAMDLLLSWYRDILLHLCGADDRLLYNGSHVEGIRLRAHDLTISRALQNVSVIEGMNRQMERNVPEKPVLGYGFSRLA